MKNLDFSKILNGFNKKNIVIIGHMSSGKTVIGKIIANAGQAMAERVEIINEPPSISNITIKYSKSYRCVKHCYRLIQHCYWFVTIVYSVFLKFCVVFLKKTF